MELVYSCDLENLFFIVDRFYEWFVVLNHSFFEVMFFRLNRLVPISGRIRIM